MPDTPSTDLAIQIPEPVARRNITEAQWRTLCNSLYPGADPRSVLSVIDYCAARHLDPLKKPCHIVPMEVRLKDNRYEWRDVVMPGIYEYRTTAHRTGEYLGHSVPEYGPEITYAGVKAPEWCQLTVYRWNKEAAVKTEFPVQIWFSEVVATKRDGTANARWSRAPRQMLTKCAEAAAIREGFPEEIGGELTAEEMDGQRAIDVATVVQGLPDVFMRLPEGLRDNVERAFSAIKLQPGQRVQKINEFLGPNADGQSPEPEEGATKLLAWAREEYKTINRAAPRTSDNKKKKPESPEPVADGQLLTADEVFE